MPEPLIHFIIPFTILSLCGISLKKSLILSSFAILPDFDVLFHVHRSITHSVVFLAFVCIPIIGFIKWKYSNYFYDSILGSLVLLSHPILDVFQTYTPILYPLYKKSVFIYCTLITDMNKLRDLRFFFEIKTNPEALNTIISSTDGAIFSSLGIGISLVILVGILLSKNNKN